MLYLVTNHEETRQQVLAAIAEAEGIGEVRTVASPEKLREYIDPDVTSCVLVDEALAPHAAMPTVQEFSHAYPLTRPRVLSQQWTPAQGPSWLFRCHSRR